MVPIKQKAAPVLHNVHNIVKFVTMELQKKEESKYFWLELVNKAAFWTTNDLSRSGCLKYF